MSIHVSLIESWHSRSFNITWASSWITGDIKWRFARSVKLSEEGFGFTNRWTNGHRCRPPTTKLYRRHATHVCLSPYRSGDWQVLTCIHGECSDWVDPMLLNASSRFCTLHKTNLNQNRWLFVRIELSLETFSHRCKYVTGVACQLVL